MMAHDIKQQTTRGKEEGGQQTTMALGQPGRERETKNWRNQVYAKRLFFRNAVCLVGNFAPAENKLLSFFRLQANRGCTMEAVKSC